MALLNINHFNNNQDLLKKFYQGGVQNRVPVFCCYTTCQNLYLNTNFRYLYNAQRYCYECPTIFNSKQF